MDLGYDCQQVKIIYNVWRNKMQIEILFLAIPAVILFGLCAYTESVATIRQSQRLPRRRSNPNVE
jgi:heme/copper-type cytochrome/quinol oxidase subunit 2